MRRAVLLAAIGAACAPGTTRPAFAPFPEALHAIINAPPARVTEEARTWLVAQGPTVQHASPLARCDARPPAILQRAAGFRDRKVDRLRAAIFNGAHGLVVGRAQHFDVGPVELHEFPADMVTGRDGKPAWIVCKPLAPFCALVIRVAQHLLELEGDAHGANTSSTVMTRTSPSFSARSADSAAFRSPTTTTAERSGWM